MKQNSVYQFLESHDRNTRTYRAVERIFRDYPGNLAVRLGDEELLNFGKEPADVTLVLHDPRLLYKLILFRDPLLLAEAYFSGSLDIEGDLYKALELKEHIQNLSLTITEQLNLLITALALGIAPAKSGDAPVPVKHSHGLFHKWRRHSKPADSKAIAFHYDVSNDFYRLWLDERMVYSCAYFESAEESLNQAQRNKLEYLCRKLRLRPGERLLDIGCGWGSLICWAAQHHGVYAHGITLSQEQYEHCQAQIELAGLQHQVTVELKDYRELQGEACYDKIVSVGMFEHVGLKNLPLYFATAKRLLKSGGLFLNHGITRDQEGWEKSVGMRFINRYVFPDGELDTVSNVQRAMEGVGYEILDVESLRPHYALTLRHWVRQLEAHEAEALMIVPSAVYRVWRLYMAACAQQFEQSGIGIHQILAAKRTGGALPVPLTRRDLYSGF